MVSFQCLVYIKKNNLYSLFVLFSKIKATDQNASENEQLALSLLKLILNI